MIDHTTKYGVSLALLFLILTITTAGTWCNKNTKSAYHENLAIHRRQLQVTTSVTERSTPIKYKKKPICKTPRHDITDQLDQWLAYHQEANEQVKYVQGYTIQVYIGGSREDAFKAKNNLHTHYDAMMPEVIYDLPNYTVRLGKFLDMLEAYPVYAAIRKHMPQAIIRPIYFRKNRISSSMIQQPLKIIPYPPYQKPTHLQETELEA